MKRYIFIPFTIAALLFSSCKNDAKKTTDVEPETIETKKATTLSAEDTSKKKVKIELESKGKRNSKGYVTFEQKGNNVIFNAVTKGLTPGVHAIHIHEKADCSSGDGASAGGHWNPTFKDHGKWGSSKGYHKGDIGNFNVDENGEGSVSMQTDEWCIGCDDETKNILGKAIIIHQGEDDFTSQPSGAAGARVSCGGIIQ